MSKIKSWFEDHVHDFSDKELKDMGYSEEDIAMWKSINPRSDKSCLA